MLRSVVTRALAPTVSGALRLSGLPTAPALDGDERAFGELAEQILADDHVTVLDPQGLAATLLVHLAKRHDVLFHGSKRGGLNELKTERESADSRAFGRQEAVFATHDPLWAMFFAVANRRDATSIINGSTAGVRSLDRRHYFLSIGITDAGVPTTTPGWVYVLPAGGFEREPFIWDVIDTGQWVSRRPVRPLAAVQVRPDGYPLRNVIRRHTADEPIWRTLWRCRSRERHMDITVG